MGGAAGRGAAGGSKAPGRARGGSQMGGVPCHVHTQVPTAHRNQHLCIGVMCEKAFSAQTFQQGEDSTLGKFVLAGMGGGGAGRPRSGERMQAQPPLTATQQGRGQGGEHGAQGAQGSSAGRRPRAAGKGRATPTPPAPRRRPRRKSIPQGWRRCGR